MLLSGASTVIAGAVVSTVPSSSALPLLPAGSSTSAVTLTGPSGNSSGTSTSKVPSSLTVVVTTWVSPLESVTVTVTTVPSGSSVVPVMVGVVSLPVSGTSTVITGAVVSIMPLSSAVPLLPASSSTSATTLTSPSGNSFGTSTSYVPSAFTVVVTTWVSPLASVTVRVTTEPSGASVVPVMVGVVSLPFSGTSTVITGAVVSMTLPFPPLSSRASASLPALSVTLASTV